MPDSEAPTVGDLLRCRRQESGLGVKIFAERTRIRRTYLEALEANRFDLLPGEAYLIGFLRVYAGALGLQPDTVLAQYHQQAKPADPPGDAERAVNVITLPSAPIKNRRSGSWAWLSAIVLVGAALALVRVTLPQVEQTSMPVIEEPSAAVAENPVAAEGTDTALPPAPEVSEAAPMMEASAGAPPNLAMVPPATASIIPAANSAPRPSGPPVATLVERPVLPITAPPVHSPPSAETIETETAETVESNLPTFTFPGNRQLRLQVLGPNKVEIHSDGRPPQYYNLTAPAVLSWRVRQTARVRIEDPSAARVWLDEKLLDLGRHSEFSLQAAEAAVNR